MPEDTSHVSKTIEDLRRQVTAKLESARSDLATINALEAAFSLPLTAFDDLFGAVGAATPAPLPPTGSNGTAPSKTHQVAVRRGTQSLRPDEYLGDEPMEAAKKYMRSVGHAVHFDDIADAVQRGGAALQGAGWRDRLELSLKRSPYQVITVAEKTYGLSDFYSEEQLKRLRTSRRGGADNAATTKKPTIKIKRKSGTNAAPKKAAKPKVSASAKVPKGADAPIGAAAGTKEGAEEV
jgi:hypothetical protein